MTEQKQREAAEQAYIEGAFDSVRDPVGSRDWVMFYRGWQAAIAQAPAVPDMRLTTHEKMRKLMTRLGIATEESMEHFAANHESNLLYLIMCADSFMDKVIAASPSAPDRNAIIEECAKACESGLLSLPLRTIAEQTHNSALKIASEAIRALKTAEGEKA